MENILILDTSIATGNRGDDIIMECTHKELDFLLKDNYELRLPTHVSSFHWYQVVKKSRSLMRFVNCRLKFVGGSNILAKNMFTHYPQWNINWFNCNPIQGSILVGVGLGAGDGRSNWYTRHLYNRVLSHKYIHSVRDERTKCYLEDDLGLKAINTGCVTMWMLTPGFCKTIPKHKSEKVVFTLTKRVDYEEQGQFIIDTLNENYTEVFFWPQGIDDYDYFIKLNHIDNIKILQSNKEAYHTYLSTNETDYVGTRLHGGIYAMRHGRRAIIIAIDERAREINKNNHLNCVDIKEIKQLPEFINSEFETKVEMDFDSINLWKSQFNTLVR